MYIKVRVTPDAKKETVKKISDDTYEISVKEPAERNRANGRVKILVAEIFRIPPGKVRLISGHRSPSKIFSLSV